jgi:hypothetical protein
MMAPWLEAWIIINALALCFALLRVSRDSSRR